MLAKSLFKKSVYGLEAYLAKKRKYPISKNKTEAILELIKQRKEENKEFAEKLLDNKIFKLAKRLMIKRENVVRRISKTGEQIIHLDFSKLFNVMLEITERGLKNGVLNDDRYNFKI